VRELCANSRLRPMHSMRPQMIVCWCRLCQSMRSAEKRPSIKKISGKPDWQSKTERLNLVDPERVLPYHPCVSGDSNGPIESLQLGFVHVFLLALCNGLKPLVVYRRAIWAAGEIIGHASTLKPWLWKCPVSAGKTGPRSPCHLRHHREAYDAENVYVFSL
jgi:hypothetical protein